jgi:hypothetical protein
MDVILKTLNINEEFTKRPAKAKVFTKVKDNIPREANYNFMADLLELPKTKEGYKYLLVMTDLSTSAFDIEPMKNKTAETTLKAMKSMFKRGILKEPYSSIQTDAGAEFMGTFHAFLKHNNIYHARTLPDRHTQNSVVEALNKQLGRLFIGYMNSIEFKTKKKYNEWSDVIDIVRTELNNYRKTPAGDSVKADYGFPNLSTEPKFKVGDVVHRALNAPQSALGYPQPTKQWRVGDIAWEQSPRKIKEVLYYSGSVPYRYILSELDNVSFTEKQLKPSVEKEEKFVVKSIIDKRKLNGRLEYKVWFKGYLKKDAEWIPRKTLVEDGFLMDLKDFENGLKQN